VLLSYEAIAEGHNADTVVERVVTTIVAPRVAPSQDGGLAFDLRVTAA
jgi:hypothetical protein